MAGEYHQYKVEPMTHDSYCGKYLKHCERNVLTVKVESCLGAVSVYIDVKPGVSDSQYLWKSANGAESGFVEKISFPIYHHKYYITVKGDGKPTKSISQGSAVIQRPIANTYTLYSSTVPGDLCTAAKQPCPFFRAPLVLVFPSLLYSTF